MANNNIIVNIDSRFRDKTFKNSTKFTTTLPNMYRNIGAIKLASIELPNLFYAFSKKKNNVSFSVTVPTSSPTPYNIEIKEGNYVSSELVDEINSKFTTLSIPITVSFDNVSGKITFTSNPLSPLPQFSINFGTGETPTLGKHLGFSENEYLNKTTLTGEGILNVVGEQYVFLRVNDYGNVISQLHDKNILAKVIINENKTNMIYDSQTNNMTKIYQFPTPQTIHKINVELFDGYGRTIEMINLDFSFTLELFQVLDQTRTNQIYYDNYKNNL